MPAFSERPVAGADQLTPELGSHCAVTSFEAEERERTQAFRRLVTLRFVLKDLDTLPRNAPSRTSKTNSPRKNMSGAYGSASSGRPATAIQPWR
jgi:hypothetical protein